MPETTDEFSKDLVSHIPYLRSYALKLTRDYSTAEDMVQDTVVNALTSRDKYIPGSHMRRWLTVILRNRYFHLRNSYGFRNVVSTDTELSAGSCSGGQEERISFLELRQAFGTLPIKQQRALFLVGAEGLTYEEAAEHTGCTIGTVKSQVSRARAQLTSLLDPV